jgi:predicted  nucleic acid-binding Zn-ribbon protein
MTGMKFFLYIAALFLLTAASLSVYAAEKTPQTTAPETAQQKEKYEKSMEERLRKLGRELDELKAKAATMSEQARKDMNRYIAEAEKKQKAASRKLDKMRKKSQKKWKKFTDEMSAAADEFEKAFEKAKSHLTK